MAASTNQGMHTGAVKTAQAKKSVPRAAPLRGNAANKVRYMVVIVNNIVYKVLVLLAYLQH